MDVRVLMMTRGTLLVLASALMSASAVLAQTLNLSGQVSDGVATTLFSVTASQAPSGNCNMQLGGTAIFCEPFTVANPGAPSRTGALDPNVWGVSRVSGDVNFGQGQSNVWGSTTLMTCTGTPTVFDPNDVTICNGQLHEATNDNPSGLFEGGNVTTLAMYPRQPFNFAGRTGTISFDVSNDTHGTHSAWPEFWMSDLPVPAPFSHFATWAAFPANGFGVRFGNDAPAGQMGLCPNANNLTVNRWTVDSGIVVRNYVSEDTAGFGTASSPPLTLTILDCVIASPDGSGTTNHVELRVTMNEIDIYATDAGVAPSAITLRKIATLTNANLTLTQGLVWLEDVHYNADKGNPPSQRQHTFVWGNVAFDGPFTHRDFGYDALDNTAAGQYPGSENLGQFSAPGASTTWNVLGVPASPNPAVVLVLFNFFHYTPPTTLTVAVNGHTQSIPWPYPDSFGNTWRTYAVTIPATDLVAGTNVIAIGATDQAIVTSNVDIVLGNVPGGVPVIPGNSRTYPGN